MDKDTFNNFDSVKFSKISYNFILVWALVIIVTSLPIVNYIFTSKFIHHDSLYVLTASEKLSETGKLNNMGFSFIFEALDKDFSFEEIGYSNGYISSVYLYSLIIKFFGKSDFNVHFFQTLLFILILFIVKEKWLSTWKNTIFFITLILAFQTLYGSLYGTVTQLPALLIALFYYNSWSKPRNKSESLITAVILAIGINFRIELFSLFVFEVLKSLYRLFFSKKSIDKNFALIFFPVCMLSIYMISQSRYLFNASNQNTYYFVNVGHDVFTSGWPIALESYGETFKMLFSNDFRIIWLKKIVKNIGKFIFLKSEYWSRPDSFIFFVPLIIFIIRPNRTEFKKLVPIYFYASGLIFLTSVTSGGIRYYDIMVFLFFLLSYKNMYNFIFNLQKISQYIFIFLLIWISSSHHIYAFRNDYLSLNKTRAKENLLKLDFANNQVKSNSVLITDWPLKWKWYNDSNNKIIWLYHSADLEVLDKILKKFPDAEICLFRKDHQNFNSKLKLIKKLKLNFVIKEDMVFSLDEN